MSLCERNIDCLECQARGMCNSYAMFKYNQGRADAFNKIMPIFLDILDEKFPWHEKANEIDELEKEWNKLKEDK